MFYTHVKSEIEEVEEREEGEFGYFGNAASNPFGVNARDRRLLALIGGLPRWGLSRDLSSVSRIDASKPPKYSRAILSRLKVIDPCGFEHDQAAISVECDRCAVVDSYALWWFEQRMALRDLVGDEPGIMRV